ncbi:MAG: hypothetical protein J7621_22450 [Niastella sp.]|nr:hypothetical protein [Niastella sp.]
MAKIILLEKPSISGTAQCPLSVYALAGWQLTRAALWPFDKLSPATIRRCQDFISDHLSTSQNTKDNFIIYCQRVLLYSRIATVSPSLTLDAPVLWLNPSHKNGYSATGEIARLIEACRISMPAYLEGVTALSEGYCQYLLQKSTGTLSRLYTRLLRLKQYGLLHLLGQIILQNSITK